MRGRPAPLPFLLAVVCLIPAPLLAFNFQSQDRDTAETLQKLMTELEGWNKEDQLQAAAALGEMGPAAQGAVPVLVRMIKTGSPEMRVVSSIALLKIDPDMRDIVPILLQALDKEGQRRGAAPPQELGLQDDALRKWSSLMRSKVDPKILPIVVNALDDNDPDIRILGVLVLGGMSAQIPEALSYVLKAYDDPEKDVRGAVLSVLSRIGPSTKEVVPGILQGLNDSEPDIRIRALIALARMGPVAQQAVPQVAGLLQRGDSEEKLAAAAALFKIDPAQSDRLIQPMILLLKDTRLESPIRLRAANLLARLQPPPAKLLSALADCLEEKDPKTRYLAAETLDDLKRHESP